MPTPIAPWRSARPRLTTPHTLSLRTAALALFALIAATVPVAACGDGSTGPEESLCDRLSFSSRAEIGIDMSCSGFESTTSGIQYDQFGRPTSYNFDIRCATGEERFTGRVFDIRWNGIGQAVSGEVEINGQRCSF